VSAHCCCKAASRGPDLATVAVRSRRDNPRLPTKVRRCLDVTCWIASASVLVLVPKCPACLAAYMALGTGIGVTFATASHLRMAALTLGTVSLALLAAQAFHRMIRIILARS
jgi:hypothetical protein